MWSFFFALFDLKKISHEWYNDMKGDNFLYIHLGIIQKMNLLVVFLEKINNDVLCALHGWSTRSFQCLVGVLLLLSSSLLLFLWNVNKGLCWARCLLSVSAELWSGTAVYWRWLNTERMYRSSTELRNGLECNIQKHSEFYIRPWHGTAVEVYHDKEIWYVRFIFIAHFCTQRQLNTFFFY